MAEINLRFYKNNLNSITILNFSKCFKALLPTWVTHLCSLKTLSPKPILPLAQSNFPKEEMVCLRHPINSKLKMWAIKTKGKSYPCREMAVLWKIKHPLWAQASRWAFPQQSRPKDLVSQSLWASAQSLTKVVRCNQLIWRRGLSLVLHQRSP